MDELNSTLYRTIGKNGCALFKLNSLYDIDLCSYEGIGENHEIIMAEFILENIRFNGTDSIPTEISIEDMTYSIEYIGNSSSILAIFFAKTNTNKFIESKIVDSEYYEVESKFYLHFVKIIMQELDIQSMIESFIKSEEQNRIASEIHDTVIQKLFSVSLKMRSLESEIASISKEEVKENIKSINKVVNSSMKTLRETIYGIRWDLNDDETFENKLNTYIQEAVDMNNTKITLNLDENTSTLTSNKKTALYRIICEGINNSIRHGKANNISIDVSGKEGFITGCIRDDGGGFDINAIAKDRQGIKNMYMITGILKGSINIDSAKGKGTEILCKIPL